MRSQLPSIITRIFPYVKTDIKLNEVLGYLQLLEQFDLQNLEMHIVPGYGSDHEGPSYYYINEEELDKLIKDVFYDTTVAGEDSEGSTTDVEDEDKVVEDKTVSIAIYNATGRKGVAGNYKNKLESVGYKVGKIDNYEQTDLQESIIYAKDKSKAGQFLQYVEGATIEEKSSLEYDIEIAIGVNSLE